MITVCKIRERIIKQVEDEIEKTKNAFRRVEIATKKRQKRRLMLKKD